MPLLIYTAIFVISTSIGVLQGNISFYKSIFYVLKYIEYFILYFMCVNVIDLEDIKKYGKYWVIVYIIVTLYAYYYYYNTTGMDIRATAPFEAPLDSPKESEPASLGGFYIIAFSLLLSFMSQYGGKLFIYSLILLIFAFPAFLYTFSRASYMAMAFVITMFFILSKSKRIFILSLLLIGSIGLLLSPYAYKKVENRVKTTFSGEYAIYKINFLGIEIKLEESAYLRYWTLKKVITQHLPQSPILGKGVTGIGLGDSQYALLLGETGIIGFLAFWFWIIRIYKIYNNVPEPLYRTLAFGTILFLSGLLIQGIGVNTFIIVRVMEPFWFIIAILTIIYRNKFAEKI